MEGKIPMAARRHVTNKLHSAYARVSKADKARILDEVMATTGMGRSSVRRSSEPYGVTKLGQCCRGGATKRDLAGVNTVSWCSMLSPLTAPGPHSSRLPRNSAFARKPSTAGSAVPLPCDSSR